MTGLINTSATPEGFGPGRCYRQRPMRAPVDTIAAPPFPADLPWVNVAPLRMDKQVGRPVLVEFWDFCRPNSLRTLPYVKAWHERYAADGLRVISVHTPGFAPSRDEAAVRAAVARLGIEHPVCIDSDGLVWTLYDNEGWPSRYLFNQASRLHDFHFGEGGYEETERAIQELLGIEREPARPAAPRGRPRGADRRPDARTSPGRGAGPTSPGRSGRSSTGAARCASTGGTIAVEHPGAYELRRATRSARRACSTSRSATASSASPCASRPGWRRPARRRSPLTAARGARRDTSSSRRTCARRAVAVDLDRAARPVRAAAARRASTRGRGPRSRVFTSRAAARQRPVRGVVARPAGRRGGCGRRSTWRASMPQRGDDGPHRAQARAPQLGPGQVGAHRPDPDAVERADAERERPRPAARGAAAGGRRPSAPATRAWRRSRATGRGRRARGPRSRRAARRAARARSRSRRGARCPRGGRSSTRPSAPAARRSKLGTVRWRSR